MHLSPHYHPRPRPTLQSAVRLPLHQRALPFPGAVHLPHDVHHLRVMMPHSLPHLALALHGDIFDLAQIYPTAHSVGPRCSSKASRNRCLTPGLSEGMAYHRSSFRDGEGPASCLRCITIGFSSTTLQHPNLHLLCPVYHLLTAQTLTCRSVNTQSLK
jgi:hypothetical protein